MENPILRARREEVEWDAKYGPRKNYAVSTRSDTYFVTARSKRDACEAMTDNGGGFDHDGISDRRIISIVERR